MKIRVFYDPLGNIIHTHTCVNLAGGPEIFPTTVVQDLAGLPQGTDMLEHEDGDLGDPDLVNKILTYENNRVDVATGELIIGTKRIDAL